MAYNVSLSSSNTTSNISRTTMCKGLLLWLAHSQPILNKNPPAFLLWTFGRHSQSKRRVCKIIHSERSLSLGSQLINWFSPCFKIYVSYSKEMSREMELVMLPRMHSKPYFKEIHQIIKRGCLHLARVRSHTQAGRKGKGASEHLPIYCWACPSRSLKAQLTPLLLSLLAC